MAPFGQCSLIRRKPAAVDLALSFVGDDPDHGRFAVHCLPHGGRGALRDMDGALPVAFPHNSSVTPVEIMELRAPIVFEKKALRPDSSGAGRARGGPGQEIVVRSIASVPMTLTVRPDKIRCAPPGLSDGLPGETGQVFVNGCELHRFPAMEFLPGDELRLLLPGGGGTGHRPIVPLRRSPGISSWGISRLTVRIATMAGGLAPNVSPQTAAMPTRRCLTVHTPPNTMFDSQRCISICKILRRDTDGVLAAVADRPNDLDHATAPGWPRTLGIPEVRAIPAWHDVGVWFSERIRVSGREIS